MSTALVNDQPAPPEADALSPQATQVQASMRVEFDVSQARRNSIVCLVLEVDRLENLTLLDPRQLRSDVYGVAGIFLRERAPKKRLFGYQHAGRLVVLVPGASLAWAESAGAELIKTLEEVREGTAAGAHCFGVSIGVATNCEEPGRPDRGRFFEALLEVAEEGAEVASAAGSDQVAHTELYSLVQARLERKNPDRAAEQRRKVEGDISTLEAAAADHGAGLFDLGYVSLDSVPAPMPTKFEPELDQAEAPAPPPVETSLGTTRPLTPRELIELRRRVENRLKTSGSDAAPERERILGRLVHELFRREGLGEGQVANLERNVLGIVQLWSEEEVSLRGGGESHESAERIDMLERRLSKLRNSLERTEQALHETQLRGTVDTGVASIFREVQGLSEYDDSFAMKKELMVSIFEANLELRERLDPGV